MKCRMNDVFAERIHPRICERTCIPDSITVDLVIFCTLLVPLHVHKTFSLRQSRQTMHVLSQIPAQSRVSKQNVFSVSSEYVVWGTSDAALTFHSAEQINILFLLSHKRELLLRFPEADFVCGQYCPMPDGTYQCWWTSACAHN